MHHSSETIGTIAAALAKAQAELTNPEKSLTATIKPENLRGPEQSFRYAPLASGLDIVRKCLGKYEIATVQTTQLDKEAGLIRLTTVLAHSSGEWLSSDWPVCPIGETASPQRMGAALTYARRYGLFTLVGIAGEDDLDASDLPVPRNGIDSGVAGGRDSDANRPAYASTNWSRRNSACSPKILAHDESAVLRSRLLVEIAGLVAADQLTGWAFRSLPVKNTLTAADARIIEESFQTRMAILGGALDASTIAEHSEGMRKVESRSKNRVSNLPITKLQRKRDQAHIDFVSSQPCLVCGRTPSDAHHLRFAQPRALGRKVSDEYTVPLCRVHHRQLHQQGNEAAWWESVKVNPSETARTLWQKSRGYSGAD